MRMNIGQIDGEGYRRLLAWNDHLAAGPLDAGLRALVEARASQINGCAFCLAMHLDEARSAGVDGLKLDALAAWRDVESFDKRERAALELTEAMTRLADAGGVSDEVWSAARSCFDDEELACLVEVVALINTFNRLNVTTQRSAEDYLTYTRRRRA
jgi:AhpD family alkylhydroperoxidase